MLLMILKTAYELPCYCPSNHCVVFLFLPLSSGIHGVSVACRTPNSALTGHKGEHLVSLPARNLLARKSQVKNQTMWEQYTKIIT